MSWEKPLPWQVAFDDHTMELTVRDESGFTQAQLHPHPDARSETGGAGLLGDLVSSFGEGLDVATWRSSRGTLRSGGEPILASLPEGTRVTIDNGRTGGWRRRHRTGHLRFDDRVYEVRHTSWRRTTVRRDDTALATLRRTGPGPGRFRADARPAYRIRFAGNAHDHRDELALVLVATVLGPPGRPGAVAEFFSWLV